MVKTSAARSSPGVESGKIPRPVPTPARASDIAIARAVAEAVRATPMVQDLSSGTAELAVTYGPRERVTGVMVRHPNPRDISIEVHVVLHVVLHAALQSGSQQSEASRSGQHRRASAGTKGGAVLTRSADQIRRAVYRAMDRLGIEQPAGVDVLIEDIQVSI
jgi:hypothetical protein